LIAVFLINICDCKDFMSTISRYDHNKKTSRKYRGASVKHVKMSNDVSRATGWLVDAIFVPKRVRCYGVMGAVDAGAQIYVCKAFDFNFI